MQPIDWDKQGVEFPEINEGTYDYQNRFNYCVWVPGTEVKLCNVTWDSTYRDVVRFSSESERDSYFDSLSSQTLDLTGYVYLRYGEPIRVNVPFGEVSQYNYLVVRNPNQPVPGYKDDGLETDPTYNNFEYFYYFINHAEYLAPNTTAVWVQLDVWQTYGYRVHFGVGYVTRGHAGIANTNATEKNLDEYLLEPEGLDIGGELTTVCIENILLGLEKMEDNPPDGSDENDYMVMISSTAALDADWGTVASPNLKCANGCVADRIDQGTEVYAMSERDLGMFMAVVSDYPWISQCIQQITMVPTSIMEEPLKLCTKKSIHGVEMYVINSSFRSSIDVTSTFYAWRDKLKEGYGDYAKYKKFLTSQYSTIEATTLTGGEILLKPECLSSKDDLEFRYVMTLSPPNIRIVIYPLWYNGDATFKFDFSGLADNQLYGGENLDLSLVVDNWPQLSITNNMYQYYLASTVHTRNYQLQSADWAQQRALLEAQYNRMNADAGMTKTWQDAAAQSAYMNSSNSIQQLQNQFDQNYLLSDNIMSGVTGTVQGIGNALSGGVASGIATAATSIGDAVYNQFKQSDYLNQKSNWLTLGLNANLTQNTQLAQSSYDYQRALRDNNFALAGKVAEGDYQNTIAGIQAKVQDARLTQPTTSGQNGGDTLLASHKCHQIIVKYKVPKPHYIKQVADYWGRYGYAINRYMQPPQDLILMTNFTYWKFVDVGVWGNIPDMFRGTIKGILEAGVTVWTDPAKIGVTMPQDNEVAVEFSYE